MQNVFKDFPKKKYDIIYADPPWNYAKPIKRSTTHIKKDIHYSTVTDDDLKNLPIQSITKDDCILFVWVVSPKMEECMNIISSWGFTYITVGFVWEKVKPTVGNYTLPSVELCLIYKKGKIPQPFVPGQRQFVHEKKREHSQKPLVVKHRIGQMFPYADKIELFARPNPSTPMFDMEDDWEYWGNY